MEGIIGTVVREMGGLKAKPWKLEYHNHNSLNDDVEEEHLSKEEEEIAELLDADTIYKQVRYPW